MKKFMIAVYFSAIIVVSAIVGVVFYKPAEAVYPTEYLSGSPTFFYEDDDFVGGTTTSGSIGKQGWVHDGGTSTVTLSTLTSRPGIINYTHTSSGSSKVMCLKDCTATTGIFDFSGNFDTTAVISMPTVGSNSFVGYIVSTASFSVYVGFHNNAGTTWNALCVATGCSTTDTGVTITAGNWYKLRIIKKGTAIEYYIDGVLVASKTTSGTGQVQPMFFNNWTTTQRYINIDYWNFIIPSYTR